MYFFWSILDLKYKSVQKYVKTEIKLCTINQHLRISKGIIILVYCHILNPMKIFILLTQFWIIHRKINFTRNVLSLKYQALFINNVTACSLLLIVVSVDDFMKQAERCNMFQTLKSYCLKIVVILRMLFNLLYLPSNSTQQDAPLQGTNYATPYCAVLKK